MLPLFSVILLLREALSTPISGLNPIDIAFIAVMAYGIYRGITQGFVKSVLTFIQFVLGFLIALRFSLIMSTILNRMFRIPELVSPILGFIIIFVMVLSALYVLSTMLEFFISKSQLGSLNRGMGIMVWIFLLTLGFSTLLMIGDESGVLSPGLKATSTTYPYLQPVSDIVWCKLQGVWPALEKIVTSFTDLIDRAASVAIGDCNAPPPE